MKEGVLAAWAAAAGVGLAGCGGSSGTGLATTAHPATSGAVAVAPRTTTTLAAKPKLKPRPLPNPGALPQTDQLPSPTTPAFHAEMAALWRAVTTNSVSEAMPAFFPKAAYVQVKQIADPAGDFTDRLVGDFRLDLAAAHALLGSDPAAARLTAVNVPQSYAHWVSPGACYNGVGYYEVPNARVVYRQGGQVRSFGIASMISWRGVWYIVHLGAVVPSAPGGTVDDPSTGPGQSAPSSTC